MEQKMDNGLSALGWNEWHCRPATGEPDAAFARVAAVDRDLLLLVNGTGTFRAKLAGSSRHHHPTQPELPCVGDWVRFEKSDADAVAVVRTLLERKTLLRRKAAGNDIEYQMIAANMDEVIIMQSSPVDFNLKRLERYLVMVTDGGAAPVILLTKTDLVSREYLQEQIGRIRAAGITAPVITLSNVTREGLAEVTRHLQPSKTYCFVGSSGVGKSTLINLLTNSDTQTTAPVSGTGEGRHTTVRRELIRLDNGALIIDTPGMREFGIIAAADGISTSYGDISRLAGNCRYRNCTHTGEPGCAVHDALNSGELDRTHFDNYLKLSRESAFYEMSYEEKRKKDRDFGKHKHRVNKERNA